MPRLHRQLPCCLWLASCLVSLLALSATAEARPSCAGERATIVGTGGRDVIKAHRKGRQVIVGLGGDDKIVAKGDRDVVCGGSGDDAIRGGRGRDQLRGGPGDDFINGGVGSDKIWAAAGNDSVVGGPGGEVAHGGPGVDRVYGQLQDDVLIGDGGDDTLLGGQGNDDMFGGAGDDWERGDTEGDSYHGEAGRDWASFATATPPGVHQNTGIEAFSWSHAWGDDFIERLSGIENILGSAFKDTISAAQSASPGVVRGLADSADSCVYFASIDCGGDPRSGSEAIAFVDDEPRDPGLFVLGTTAPDRWNLRPTAMGVEITAQTPLAAGPGCQDQGAGRLFCPTPGTLDYVVAFGGNGDDQLAVSGRFPAMTFVKLDGGLGNDRLVGGSGPEVLTSPTISDGTGPDEGKDTFIGRGGDDVLVGTYPGTDVLMGGRGADQLVTDDVCDGGLFNGGRGGPDIAGFGHLRLYVRWLGIRAKLGGSARPRKHRPGCRPLRILANNEVLEGTSGRDILIGSPGDDPLIVGRKGNDILRGRGGGDVLRGEEGNDSYFGGAGADVLEARDGARDRIISCGAAGRRALRDRADPGARGC